jgi:hypothetical protein
MNDKTHKGTIPENTNIKQIRKEENKRPNKGLTIIEGPIDTNKHKGMKPSEIEKLKYEN